MKEHFKWVEFFVYTASIKTWATQEIAWIEKSLGIKFNRPIFTREDCVVDGAGQYKKSLAKIMPRVWRSVTKGSNLSKSDRMYVTQKQLMVIDNSAVYMDFTDKLLLCPDYDYVQFEDVLDGVHDITSAQLLSLVNQGVACPNLLKSVDPKKGGDHVKHMAERYTWMANKCNAVAAMNEVYRKDQFWRRLRKLIVNNKLTTFTVDVIQGLQNAVWAPLKKVD
jgi:hypothetical protein